MFKLTAYLLFLIFLTGAYGIGFEGKLINVPEDAIESQSSNLKSPILNGLNYQARISVSLIKLDSTDELQVRKYPVKQDFTFEVNDILEGEYELLVHSYDFDIRNTRYKVMVDQSHIQAFEIYLGSDSFNSTSAQVLGDKNPLILEITDYKQYYQGGQSKLSELIMNSPLGVIFQNKLYTILAGVTVIMMIGPPLLSTFAPELAERFNELQQEANEMRATREAAQNPSEASTNVIHSIPETKPSGNSRRRK